MDEVASRDEIQSILERQIDDGATFSSIRQKQTLVHREGIWSGHKSHIEREESFTFWTLSSLFRGTWMSASSSSLDGLKKSHDRLLEAVKDVLDYRGIPVSTQHALAPKPVRQVRDGGLNAEALPPDEILGEFLQEWRHLFSHPLDIKYQDRLIHSQYWDSEHTLGESFFVNAELKVSVLEGDRREERKLYHCASTQQPLSLQELTWTKELRRWNRTLSEEVFRGPNPEDFCWILSSRAFAQLIQGTLGPTLCLQRPDPFCEDMNPASLDEEAIAPECLTITCSPALSGDNVVDEEGVRMRSLPLIENGILKHFLMTRSSAQLLHRSLPVHKKIVLPGCARLDSDNHQIFPDMRCVEVSPGASLEKDLRLSHVLISDLEVTPLGGTKDRFMIRSNNALVNKFGGQHRRHLPSFSFVASRQEIWSRLQTIGIESGLITLPSPRAVYEEPMSFFKVPMARFSGFPCSWT